MWIVKCDVDVDEYFEQLDGEFSQMTGSDTRSFSEQCIVSKISVDIEFSK